MWFPRVQEKHWELLTYSLALTFGNAYTHSHHELVRCWKEHHKILISPDHISKSQGEVGWFCWGVKDSGKDMASVYRATVSADVEPITWLCHEFGRKKLRWSMFIGASAAGAPQTVRAMEAPDEEPAWAQRHRGSWWGRQRKRWETHWAWILLTVQFLLDSQA